MSVKTQLALSLAILLVAGCADEGQPAHVKHFEGATNVVAPATGYYLSPPPEGEAGYFMTLPRDGQAPDGQFKDGKKIEVLEEAGEYVKVRMGEDGDDTDPIEAYVLAKFVPAGRFAAGTRVEVLETTAQYAKVKTGDGIEAYVKPKFIKDFTPEG